jgi:hypothetical protein
MEPCRGSFHESTVDAAERIVRGIRLSTRLRLVPYSYGLNHAIKTARHRKRARQLAEGKTAKLSEDTDAEFK